MSTQVVAPVELGVTLAPADERQFEYGPAIIESAAPAASRYKNDLAERLGEAITNAVTQENDALPESHQLLQTAQPILQSVNVDKPSSQVERDATILLWEILTESGKNPDFQTPVKPWERLSVYPIAQREPELDEAARRAVIERSKAAAARDAREAKRTLLIAEATGNLTAVDKIERSLQTA